MGKHKKSKAKENKDKKAERKLIEREFTGSKYVRYTHKVQASCDRNANKFDGLRTREELIMQQMMFQNTN